MRLHDTTTSRQIIGFQNLFLTSYIYEEWNKRITLKFLQYMYLRLRLHSMFIKHYTCSHTITPHFFIRNLIYISNLRAQYKLKHTWQNNTYTIYIFFILYFLSFLYEILINTTKFREKINLGPIIFIFTRAKFYLIGRYLYTTCFSQDNIYKAYLNQTPS